MANRDPIVDMSPGVKAWFEDQAIKVDGFESTDCPHGVLVNKRGYFCTHCNQEFVVIPVEVDEQ